MLKIISESILAFLAFLAAAAFAIGLVNAMATLAAFLFAWW